MSSSWEPPAIAADTSTLRLAPAGPIVHTPWVQQRARADIEAEAAREAAALARTRRPTSVVGGLRVLWAMASMVGVISVLIDARLSALSVGAACAALIVWTGLAAVNVRRARPATVYAGPPSPALMMVAWLVPMAGAAFAVRISRGAEPFTAVWFGDAAVLGLLVFLGALAPVSMLARLAAWAGDRPAEWWQWLAAPVLTLALSILLTVMFKVPLGDLLASDSTAAVSAGFFGSFVLLALPAFVFVAVGWRAMRRLEAAARMTWERRAFPEGSLVIDSEMTARLATKAYLGARPNG